MRALNCPACNTTFGFYGQAEPDDQPDPSEMLKCPDCSKKMPPSLIKACGEPGDYALKTRMEEIIFFSQAEIHGQFAHLTLKTGPKTWRPFGMPCPQGIDLRLSDIVWCADRPHGEVEK